MKDINGIDITEGCVLQYSSYTPSENVEKGKVYINEQYGGLWVKGIPVSLLHSHGLDYRKLKVLHWTKT